MNPDTNYGLSLPLCLPPCRALHPWMYLQLIGMSSVWLSLLTCVSVTRPGFVCYMRGEKGGGGRLLARSLDWRRGLSAHTHTHAHTHPPPMLMI